MKFYSTIKKDDIIKFAYKLIELKNVMSSETIKTQEGKFPMFYKLQILRQENIAWRNHRNGKVQRDGGLGWGRPREKDSRT